MEAVAKGKMELIGFEPCEAYERSLHDKWAVWDGEKYTFPRESMEEAEAVARQVGAREVAYLRYNVLVGLAIPFAKKGVALVE